VWAARSTNCVSIWQERNRNRLTRSWHCEEIRPREKINSSLQHLEAPSLDVDLDNLKRKVDAGADAIVTQLFYDNTDFYRFRDLCESKGITTPVVPGLLPVTSLSQIQRITDLCGAKLPANFIATLESDSSEVGQFKAGVDHAVTQTEDLVANGVAGLHYYVLNKSDATAKILERVSL